MVGVARAGRAVVLRLSGSHPEIVRVDSVPGPTTGLRLCRTDGRSPSWSSFRLPVTMSRSGPVRSSSSSCITGTGADLARGVWMPQVGEAERAGWPEEYTGGGMKATRGFLRGDGIGQSRRSGVMAP